MSQDNQKNTPSAPQHDSFLAGVSLILAVASLVSCGCGFLPIAVSIVFAIVDRKKRGSWHGMALSGLILSILSLVLSIALLIVFSTNGLFSNLL